MKLASILLLAIMALAQSPDRNVTPLWEATMNGDTKAVNALLKNGADPNSALPGGETALMTAARTGNVQIIETLVARGANVNARGPEFGETALMVAASENQPDAVRAL